MVPVCHCHHQAQSRPSSGDAVVIERCLLSGKSTMTSCFVNGDSSDSATCGFERLPDFLRTVHIMLRAAKKCHAKKGNTPCGTPLKVIYSFGTAWSLTASLALELEGTTKRSPRHGRRCTSVVYRIGDVIQTVAACLNCVALPARCSSIQHGCGRPRHFLWEVTSPTLITRYTMPSQQCQSNPHAPQHGNQLHRTNQTPPAPPAQ